MKIGYVVAYFSAEEIGGSWLAGVGTNHQMEPGWYLMNYDDEGREGFLGGPFDTALAALSQSDG